MEKLGKIILIGVVLIAIAVPLGFIVSHNAKARIAKFAEQGIDVGLGVNTLPAIDKTREVANLTDQTNQEITQMIEDLTGTTTSDETISTPTTTSTN